MYNFEWFEQSVSRLKRDLEEEQISQPEFNKLMRELQRRKAEEPEMLERLTKAGIDWA